MKLNQLLEPSLLETMYNERFITCRPHEQDPNLVIYNYTPQAAYSRTWNDVTETCRGLVVRDGVVVGRPFRKFYRYDEVMELPQGKFTAYDKADGSLGIGYIAPDGRAAIATRGSFHSEQAEWGTEWLRARPDLLAEVEHCISGGFTPLFEIVYSENRIVLDYGDFSGLILLAAIHIETGQDAILSEVMSHWTGRTVEKWENETFESLMAKPSFNREGYVLLYGDGTRIKVKFDEYVRLHKILTGITERTIWEFLSTKMNIDRMAEYIPDEFFKWMKDVALRLETEFSEIEKECLRVYSGLDLFAARKEQAEKIDKHKYKHIIFKMLDQKPYANMIWQLIYPEAKEVQYED